MNELVILDEHKIESMIYKIRGQQVMLDSDLACLYQCVNGTKTINQAVKRHIDRFPEDFCFQITKEEFDNLKSQFGTSSWNDYGGIRKLPYAFTEQGVAMLSAVLRTDVASKMSVSIMRAFVAIRKYISTNMLEQKYINELVFRDNKRIDILEKTFSKFEEKKKINEIYFEGQIYDAYSKLVDIFREAKHSLIICDGYADKTVLDMISNTTIPTTLITKKKGPLKKLDIDKYLSQYDNLTLIYDDSFHDRYIIIDDKKVYHCGTSINYAGSRTFSINVLEDNDVIEFLLMKIKRIVMQ